jgi:hypothetical protein
MLYSSCEIRVLKEIADKFAPIKPHPPVTTKFLNIFSTLLALSIKRGI